MTINYRSHSTRFKALGHPVRLAILDMLRRGEACVCHMEVTLNKRQPYISQQLMVLRDAELVSARKEGMKVFYSLKDPAVLDVLERTLGPIPPDEPVGLTGCPCAICGTEPINDILRERAQRHARQTRDLASGD